MALKSKTTPWSYRKGNTMLHRMPAGLKLVFLLFLSVLAFFPSLIALGAIAVILALFSFVARIGPWGLFRGSGPLFFVVLAAFLVQAVDFFPQGMKQGFMPGIRLEGLNASLIFCARIGLAFAAASLLFSVTTPGEIRKSLGRLEDVLRIKKLKLSLGISLMLEFLKRFFEVWEDLNLAWKSRRGKNNLSRLKTLIPLVIERMMLKANETASALESRNAGGDDYDF
jgi:energy-coupling factor transporter transmembrane protein EcfT